MSRDIQIDDIRPNPRQPRKRFFDIEGLAESLRDKGQLTPLLVRPLDAGYEIVHGERRWRAARMAGLQTLRCEVREIADDEAFRLALVENLQRDNLTAIEEAEAYSDLIAQGMTQVAVGRLVGKSQSYVAHKLRLLSAPEPLKVLVAQGALSEGHIRQLLRIEAMYPEDTWSHLLDAPVEDVTVKGLCIMYNVLRPEDNPPAALWLYPFEQLEACPHRDALVDSWSALMGSDGERIPAWVVTAWWWASAVVLENASVALTKTALDGWQVRYLTAAWEVLLMKSPAPREGKGEAANAAASLWWGYRSDLRHAGCGKLDPDQRDGLMGIILDWWKGLGGLPSAYPSALQPWGFQHDVVPHLYAD